MQTTPQITPISDFRLKQNQVLQLMENGPVYLAQHSKAKAVLVSIADWDSMIREMARLRRIIEGDNQLSAIRNGDYVEYAPTPKQASN